jgi:aldehyde dehydrogenase (NAD+)
VRLATQRRFFASGATLTRAARRSALEKLPAPLRCHEDAALEALAADVGKHASEACSSELGYLYQEIRYALPASTPTCKPDRNNPHRNPPQNQHANVGKGD